MNWKPVILTATLLGTAGLAYAGYRFFKKQKTLLMDYTVAPVGVKIVEWSKELAKVEFTIRITNKSDIEATMQQLYADVYLDSKNVGYVKNNTLFVIPAKGSNDVSVTAIFSPDKILGSLAGIFLSLLSTKDIMYRLNGYVKMKSSFVGVSIPFDYTSGIKKDLMGSLPVPVLSLK